MAKRPATMTRTLLIEEIQLFQLLQVNNNNTRFWFTETKRDINYRELCQMCREEKLRASRSSQIKERFGFRKNCDEQREISNA